MTDQHMDRCIVQRGETVFTTVPGSISVDLGYRQLFLYVIRHYREMIPRSTKMELKGRKKMMEDTHSQAGRETRLVQICNFGGLSRVRVWYRR